MADNIYFGEGKQNVESFIENEYSNFPTKLTAQLINFVARLCFYEEEGTKLRPTILFTNKIDTVIKTVGNAIKQPIFEDENENMFRSRMKSLSPFSAHKWNIYVQLNSTGTIEYGIYRSLNSIKEHSFNINLFLNDELKSRTNSIFAFLVQSISNSNILFKSLKGEEMNLNFSLENKKLLKFNDEISEFVDASFSKLKTTKKKLNDIKTLYQNTFENCFRNIHGCICVVVDKDYKDNGFFQDGIWLNHPIEFSKLFMQSNSYSETKLESYSELFMDMLNYDGITIVDNKGRIRAYNVFVETSASKESNIMGGARKRAAFTIINSKVKKIVGVYFQSQEGEIFYNRNRNYRERKTKNLGTILPTISTSKFNDIKQKPNLAKSIPLFSEEDFKKVEIKTFVD
jgi:hypothetical protein